MMTIVIAPLECARPQITAWLFSCAAPPQAFDHCFILSLLWWWWCTSTTSQNTKHIVYISETNERTNTLAENTLMRRGARSHTNCTSLLAAAQLNSCIVLLFRFGLSFIYICATIRLCVFVRLYYNTIIAAATTTSNA